MNDPDFDKKFPGWRVKPPAQDWATWDAELTRFAQQAQRDKMNQPRDLYDELGDFD